MARKILDSDNMVLSALTMLGNLFILNFFFLICCLPVVTIGASLSAVNQTAMKMARHEDGPVSKEFFGAFLKDFKQSTIIWAMLLLVAFILGGDFYYAICCGHGIINKFFMLFATIMTIAVLLVFTYIFPISSRYENTIIQHIKNSMLIAISNMHLTLLIWLIWIVSIGVNIFYPQIFRRLGFIWFFCGFSFLFYICGMIYRKIFDKVSDSDR